MLLKFVYCYSHLLEMHQEEEFGLSYQHQAIFILILKLEDLKMFGIQIAKIFASQ